MLNSNLFKNILSLLVIIVVVFLAFRYVTRAPDVPADGTSNIGVSSSEATTSSNPADEFSRLLDRLSTVDFQQGNPIFNNPVFKNGLVSYSRELPIIDRSRSNPFAPIEGNPSLYIRYAAPVPASLSTTTNSLIFPIATSTATTSIKKK